jgi:hypothetical protein
MTSILFTLAALAALVVVSDAAFVPRTCSNRLPKSALAGGFFQDIKEKIADTISDKIQLPETFKDVHLPEYEGLSKIKDIANLNLPSSVKFIKFQLKWKEVQKELEKQDKKSSLKCAQDLLKESEDFEKNIPSKSYKYFGDSENRVNELITLVKNNPFVASALTETHNGFEIKSYDPEEKNPSLFLKYMRTNTGVGHKVNFDFTHDLKVKSFTVFDEDGKERKDVDMEEWAGSLIYNLGFVASCIHATIHVLHFLLTAGFEYASKDYKEMHTWAKWYEKAIGIKYIEVAAALIADAPEPIDNEEDAKFRAIITGPDGFGSSQEIRPMLKDLLDSWGQNPTAKGFLESTLSIPIETLQKHGILTEFMKHVDLVEPYAAAASEALKKTDPAAFATAEATLKKYLEDCGEFKSNIDTLDSWLQLMATTGIFHGSTLSYTRLIGTVDVARWRNIEGTKWDRGDLNLLNVGLATVVGMDEGRHAMSSEIRNLDDNLKAVLEEYDAKTTALKETYLADLLKHPDFDDLGFILSDYCPDGFDGKQLTIATYF